MRLAWGVRGGCLWLIAGLLCCLAGLARADRIQVAAAADLQFAMEALVASFKRQHPQAEVVVIYGSSGKFLTQIQQGAPFDLYFSADEAYPQRLIEQGLALAPARVYARGRLALWSTTLPPSALSLAQLGDAGIRRIAIANPAHAPYGRRAQEALVHAGVWEQVQPKLIKGENIAQAAVFVQTGHADVGLIALSLLSGPARQIAGAHVLVPEQAHSPLNQAFVVTRNGADKPLARRFAQHVMAPMSVSIMASYGFMPPPSR